MKQRLAPSSHRALASLALCLALVAATAATAAPVGAAVAPVAQAPIVHFAVGTALGTVKVPLRVSWSPAKAGGSALYRYYLQRRADGGSWSAVSLPSRLSLSATIKLRPGRLHQFRLRVVDLGGTSSVWAVANPVWLHATPEADLDIAYSGSWAALSPSYAFGGSLAASSQAGASAGLDFTATEIAWVSTRGPKRGRATVSVTGRPDVTVDLRAASRQVRRIVYVSGWAASEPRHFSLRVAGTAGRPRVDIDAFVTLGPPPVSVLVGAGDIALCATNKDEATAAIVASVPGTVFTTGDNAYPDGSVSNFANCYGPSWGPFKARTRPSPGNHEYVTAGAAPYFAYFGKAAGRPGAGWYAYDSGTWRIYSLNSNCAAIGGCGSTSTQYAWLKADLAANPRRCVAAYWHHPRFSSGPHGSSTRMASILQLLYSADADVVLGGHDHLYERYAPITPTGAADPATGIRHFVVGTGGAALYAPSLTPKANSEVILAETHGVLKLTLSWSAYQWEFLPTVAGAPADQGTASCH